MIPQALPLHVGVALGTLVVHAAATVETKRQLFESALHVSISLALVQTGPALVHVGSLLQMQAAPPSLSVLHAWCGPHVTGELHSRQPLALATHVATPFERHSLAPLRH